MLEPDVTITDFILAIQCFWFALLLYKRPINLPWLLLFGSLSLAALTGGITHGFSSDETINGICDPVEGRAYCRWRYGTGGMVYWRRFSTHKTVAWWIKQLAAIQFLLFTVVILFYSQSFLLAAVNYLPTAVFLFFVFVRSYFKTNERAPFSGAISILLTLLGSFVQIAKISLHPQYFNHNALYHAIQFIAICFLFVTARWDIARRSHERP